MIYEVSPEDGNESPEEKVPNEETEMCNAVAFLQKASRITGDNLYDHLTDVLKKILAERPENIIDFFEEYSRKVKEKRFISLTNHLEDIYIPPGKYDLAHKVMQLLKPLAPDEPSTVDPDDIQIADMVKNDMLQLLFFMEHVGIGIPRDEMFYMMLSIKKLTKYEPISSLRFWGVIYGTYKNYFIIECDLKDEEYIKRNEKTHEEELLEAEEEAKRLEEETAQQEMQQTLETIGKNQELGAEDVGPGKVPRKLPPLPIIAYEKFCEPPIELSGVGINKKVYYVSNGPGEPWIQLPDTTPKQIRISRQIYKSFTGNLDQGVVTYPEFPGTERDYLRCQIARISAGTQISPLGFYTFGGAIEAEDEEQEEAAPEAPQTTFFENKKYDALPIKDLTDGSMSFWVHHTQYILPQGRTTWWNPNPLPEGGDMDEEMGEEEEEVEKKPKASGPEPETGPPLLTPCSEDATLEAIKPWSVRISSTLMDEHALAIVRSNLWPGAYCFSTQSRPFFNVYFGTGLKYMTQNFSPLPLTPVQQDYPTGPEVMEILDPTGAEEEEWRIAHLPKPPPIKVVGEAGEEAEEEEEEEEEEDD